MRILLVTVALALLSASSFAAVEYEFVQKNASDDGVTPATDLTARATIDGLRARVDFLTGTLYPPGTYVISSDGWRRLYFVDPTRQSYTEVNAAGVATALGASNIRIENQKSELVRLPDRPVIAGIETDHYRLTLSYDITVTLRSISLTQHVQTDIDSWTTLRFGTLQPTALSNPARTGNPELDRLLSVETSKIDGFPLRQIVTIRASYEVPHKSQLQVPKSRTITRETWVTAIRETEPRASVFVLPASYRRADQEELPRSATQTLTFEPAN